MNGHVSVSEQLLQGVDQDRSQGCSRIESNLDNVSLDIDPEKATDMEDVTHHAQHAIRPQLGSRQPATGPDDRIMGQTAQLHQHLLSFKAFFVAPGQAQALLIAL